MLTRIVSVATTIDSALRIKASGEFEVQTPIWLRHMKERMELVPSILNHLRPAGNTRFGIPRPNRDDFFQAEIETLRSAFPSFRISFGERNFVAVPMHSAFRDEVLISTCEDEKKFAARKYIKLLERTWDNISKLLENSNLAETLRPLTTPFIHELYYAKHGFDHSLYFRALITEDKKARLRRDSLERSALHVGTERCDLLDWYDIFEMTKCLIDNRDLFGRTPLHIACAAFGQDSQHNVIKTLLRNDADISIRDLYGMMALDYVIQDKRPDILVIFRDLRGIYIDDILFAMGEVQSAEKRAQIAARKAIQADKPLRQ